MLYLLSQRAIYFGRMSMVLEMGMRGEEGEGEGRVTDTRMSFPHQRHIQAE
jgi:hypothetical protein